MVPYKTTLSSFKCWQPIQIFINHCVGQIKHVWGLNLAQRPPLFNLCSRRRTEFQLVWNKSLCGTNRLEFWMPTLSCHVTPPLYSCKSETGLEPRSWKEKKHRRRSSMVGYGGGGWGPCNLAAIQVRRGLAGDRCYSDEGIKGAMGRGRLSDCVPRKPKSL